MLTSSSSSDITNNRREEIRKGSRREARFLKRTGFLPEGVPAVPIRYLLKIELFPSGEDGCTKEDVYYVYAYDLEW